MGKTLDNEKLLRMLHALMLNTSINDYAVERVAFGFENPGDQVPIDLYLSHLHLSISDGLHKRSDIPGVYIDEQERISAEQDYAEYVRDLFVMQMERIFTYAPKDIRLERDGEEIPLPPRFRNYLFGLLPLFAEVLSTEVEYDAFDIIPTDKKARAAGYSKWRVFVTDMLLKPLESGSKINRYVKDITATPHYIRRLIEKKGRNYYLKPTDVNGYEYKFALFSLMLFKNDENGKLLENKMLEWERIHNP